MCFLPDLLLATLVITCSSISTEGNHVEKTRQSPLACFGFDKESARCRPLLKCWKDGCCCTRSWGTSLSTVAASPTVSCPTEPASGAYRARCFQTLNANFSTAAWEQQIEQAASIWEQAANLNLSRVSDGGEAVASSGDQQDDPRFGDIRIGAVPLGPGTLAVTFLPPPANGGTDAGDILLNSSINWQINSNYDLMTVMAHEFGHALGLGDVSTPTNPYPVMYGSYVGINQALTSDDIAGIQAVDGVRQFDAYNINGARNITYMSAANITSKIGSNGQAAIPNLDITTGGDSEWFYVTVPQATTGTMNVTVQSTNLSSLSPKLMVYTSSLGLVGQASAVNSMGATVSVSTSVSANQGYYIKVLAAGGYGAIGGYGLLLNFGSQTQAPIPPPNTVVAQQPDRSGGSLNNGISIAGSDQSWYWCPGAGLYRDRQHAGMGRSLHRRARRADHAGCPARHSANLDADRVVHRADRPVNLPQPEPGAGAHIGDEQASRQGKSPAPAPIHGRTSSPPHQGACEIQGSPLRLIAVTV